MKDKNGNVAATEEQQIEIITEHFKKMLGPETDKENFKYYKPKEMKQPFTGKEINKASKSLKNGKSAGTDNIEIEFVKYAPISIHKEIAKIFNTVAKSGEEITELIMGILRPLQKPGKPKGPVENLRPVILLSVLRKILTICMIRRTWERLKQHIPQEQAAYQPGRGTTEQVFAIKLLAEKAIVSNDYKIHLLLLDMSKAFDTVNRKTLFEELEEILDEDELHILSILTNQPEIKVKVGNITGRSFETYKGILQGDCLSAILFILYLAKCLSKPMKTRMKGFCIQPKYADDMTYASTAKREIDDIEEKMPKILEKFNLEINNTKTERYQIPKPPPPIPPPPSMETLLKHKEDKIKWSELDWLTNYEEPVKDDIPNWKDCKLLGSKLDTEKDINRRKGLTIDSMRIMNEIYSSKNLNIELKIRAFNVFTASIFLYNSELWTLTKTLEKLVDSFQRRLLRKVIGIYWPKKNIKCGPIYKNQNGTMEQKNSEEKIKLVGSSHEARKRDSSKKGIYRSFEINEKESR